MKGLEHKWLHLALAALAAVETCLLRGWAGAPPVPPPPALPNGGVQLSEAPPAWYFKALLSDQEVAHVKQLVQQTPAPAWQQCVETELYARQNVSAGDDLRQCTQLRIGGDSVLESVRARLGEMWPLGGLPSFNVRMTPAGSPQLLTHQDGWSDDLAPLHANWWPDLVGLLYLTDAPKGTGRVVFPRSGLAVAPKPGALFAFQIKRSTRPDGTHEPCPYAAHYVEAYPPDAAHARLALQFSVDFDADAPPPPLSETFTHHKVHTAPETSTAHPMAEWNICPHCNCTDLALRAARKLLFGSQAEPCETCCERDWS